VLTAAHCILESCARRATVGEVAFGAYTPANRTYRVRRMTLHPDYRNRGQWYNDLALLELDDVVAGIRPAVIGAGLAGADELHKVAYLPTSTRSPNDGYTKKGATVPVFVGEGLLGPRGKGISVNSVSACRGNSGGGSFRPGTEDLIGIIAIGTTFGAEPGEKCRGGPRRSCRSLHAIGLLAHGARSEGLSIAADRLQLSETASAEISSPPAHSASVASMRGGVAAVENARSVSIRGGLVRQAEEPDDPASESEETMRYMLLITAIDPKTHHANMSKEDGQKLAAAYMRYTDELKKAGILLDSEALHFDDRNAARVTAANGKRSVIDGPFAETKELVGGYYVIQVNSKEEAIEWAARCPGAHYPDWAYVEVREVMEFA
jgi:hypothetical protein